MTQEEQSFSLPLGPRRDRMVKCAREFRVSLSEKALEEIECTRYATDVIPWNSRILVKFTGGRFALYGPNGFVEVKISEMEGWNTVLVWLDLLVVHRNGFICLIDSGLKIVRTVPFTFDLSAVFVMRDRLYIANSIFGVGSTYVFERSDIVTSPHAACFPSCLPKMIEMSFAWNDQLCALFGGDKLFVYGDTYEFIREHLVEHIKDVVQWNHRLCGLNTRRQLVILDPGERLPVHRMDDIFEARALDDLLVVFRDDPVSFASSVGVIDSGFRKIFGFVMTPGVPMCLEGRKLYVKKQIQNVSAYDFGKVIDEVSGVFSK
jgi:hypothetical protein